MNIFSLIRQQLITAWVSFFGYPVRYNVNRGDEAQNKKRCLFVYLVSPFFLDESHPSFLNHQNFRQCKQIASVLDEFGYIVDAVDFRDERFVPHKKYDLIISHRVVHRFDDKISSRENLKVYFFSGVNHILFNVLVKKAYDRLEQRRGIRLMLGRLTSEYMPYVKAADAFVGFGNDAVVDSWKTICAGRGFFLNNYGFRETKFIHEEKDFFSARKNFLFFASGTQVMKGLDLLLEIFFRHPELNLYVCSDFKGEKDFCRFFEKELFKTKNIHPIGRVPVNGSDFYGLCRTCAYVVLPSVVEGQAGSVTQCMYAGLIPVVTNAVGIDVADFGVFFRDDSIEELERTICRLADLPETWHREHSIATRKAAEAKYSEEAFIERWRKIVMDLEKIKNLKDNF